MLNVTTRIWTDIELVPEARELLSSANVVLDVEPEGSLARIDDADAAIVGSLFFGNAALFARATWLQVVARSGIGYDRIDVSAATAAGVCAVNTPEAPTESTAEFTLALMLAVARRLVAGAGPLAKGKWESAGSLAGFDLAGKTLGLVGCGRIGRRVAELARPFHMTVQAFDPAATLPADIDRVSTLNELLGSSDVISLHVPLSPETRHLMSFTEFSQCKPGAIFINTARGPLVNEAALVAALHSGVLMGAGLDVWEPEPPASDSPLLQLPNVIATPHMAASTREGRRRSHTAAVSQVLQVLRGECPPCILNPEVWLQRRLAGPKVRS